MGRGAARIDQEMPGRMARRNINMHYGTMDSGPQLPPHYSGNITWIRDASKIAVSATVYCTARKRHNSRFGLLKISVSETSNLESNVERSIDTVKVSSVHCWSDSTVALYWLNRQGEYRQFVSNRVAKIKEQGHVQ